MRRDEGNAVLVWSGDRCVLLDVLFGCAIFGGWLGTGVYGPSNLKGAVRAVKRKKIIMCVWVVFLVFVCAD